MASTRQTLESITDHVDESMGVRDRDVGPRLSPVPHPRDAGRFPLRNVGKLDIDKVMPDPNQPRAVFSDEATERLAQSIREKGQLSAIRVRWSEEHGKWIIIAGERRWRATKNAGLPTIDCYFHDGQLSKSEVLQQQLIENCLREDLQPMEEARAFSTLMQLNGWNAKQLAEALRLAPSKISRTLALLRLPAEIQRDVASGKIPARSAYELSRLKGQESQRRLARKVSAGALTQEQTVKAVRQRRGKPAPRPRGIRLSFLDETGFRVTVSANKKGTYYDIEQALVTALEEVRHRIENNVQLF
jgi:ParB family chromosome partitioning protein